MSDDYLPQVETVVRRIAQTAVENEDYFSRLDAVVGDGDFGFSLARGFEVVLETWDELDRVSTAAFLRRVAITITSRTGGTSGPIWGTAFVRAAAAFDEPSADGSHVVVRALRAAVVGIKDRGKAELGDKTLLDALVPAIDELETELGKSIPLGAAAKSAAKRAREAAEATSSMQARRGRASYSGQRSIGSPDPGAVAIALMLEDIAAEAAPPTSAETNRGES